MLQPTLSPPISSHVLHSHSHQSSSDVDLLLNALTSANPARELDSILFAAAVGPLTTRHHRHHWFADPPSEKDGGPAHVHMSAQMPRSQRLRQEAEKEENEVLGAIAPMLLKEEAMLGRPLSVRPHTPPTPPLEPSSKRVRYEEAPAFGTPPPLSLLLPEVEAARAVPELVAPLLPLELKCMARTRIPTPYGPMFLHVYHNNHDGKEHLAIVCDPVQLASSTPEAGALPSLRSRTLDAVWHEGETEQERLVRGAYVARLTPSERHASAPASVPSTLADAPLVRIHSECFTGETIGSLRCDCGEQLDAALRALSVAGRGVVVYLRQEGRGIGLLAKVRAYNLQDMGLDTVQANLALGRGADERAYGPAAAILRDLGVRDNGIRLMTNNPAKVDALEQEGVRVVQRVPMVPRDWAGRTDSEMPYTAPHTPVPGNAGEQRGAVRSEELDKYLRTKVERMGHMLQLPRGADGM